MFALGGKGENKAATAHKLVLEKYPDLVKKVEKAQDLFGVDACSSHLYLGDGSGEFRDVPVLPAAPESPKRRKRKTLPDAEAADAFASLLEGEKPLGVTSDDTTAQWGQVLFVRLSRLPPRVPHLSC